MTDLNAVFSRVDLIRSIEKCHFIRVKEDERFESAGQSANADIGGSATSAVVIASTWLRLHTSLQDAAGTRAFEEFS